jgi:hypothetical protein
MTTGPVEQFHVRLSNGQAFGPASMELIEQWAREGRIPVDALLAPLNGSAVRSVLAEPRLRSALQPSVAMMATPPTAPGPVKGDDASGAGVMIPYKNPPALIGYYMAVASLIPVLGALLGPVAVGLGIAGLRKRLKNPEVHGIAHAWIAIILGGICGIGYITLLVISARMR